MDIVKSALAIALLPLYAPALIIYIVIYVVFVSQDFPYLSIPSMELILERRPCCCESWCLRKTAAWTLASCIGLLVVLPLMTIATIGASPFILVLAFLILLVYMLTSMHKLLKRLLMIAISALKRLCKSVTDKVSLAMQLFKNLLNATFSFLQDTLFLVLTPFTIFKWYVNKAINW